MLLNTGLFIKGKTDTGVPVEYIEQSDSITAYSSVQGRHRSHLRHEHGRCLALPLQVVSLASRMASDYLCDGANAVQETQGTAVNPILTGLAVDERFARNEGSTRTYFLTDALGSTVALANAGGTLLQQYQYDPYGNVSTSGGATNPYQYTGRENDGTGLYYYRARYYSAAMGRFISEDAVGFSGGQLSFYGYAGESPLMYRDPSGHFLPEAAIIGGAWGAVNGIIAGDNWKQVVVDGLAGAGTGALIGLTDGMSLVGGIAARSVISMGD